MHITTFQDPYNAVVGIITIFYSLNYFNLCEYYETLSLSYPKSNLSYL